MAIIHQEEEQNVLGIFLIISFLLHLVILIFFPQIYGGSSIGSLPLGEGAMQLSIRLSDTPKHTFNITPSVTPSMQYSPQVQPEAKPDNPVSEITPPSPPEVVVETRSDMVEPVFSQTPQVNLEPKPESVSPVIEVTPEVAEVAPVVEVKPDLTTQSNTPVMTSDSGTVSISTSEAGVSEANADGVEASVQSVYGEEISPEVTISAPVESSPPPPPPPPAASSMLQLPGPAAMPKNLVLSSSIDIRVFLEIDESGNIISAYTDPIKNSDDENINHLAIEYAKNYIEASPLQDGQAYSGSVIVTFDPEERARGLIFRHDDANEFITILNR